MKLLTVIAGESMPNDYCLIHEGPSLGRIRLAEEKSSQGVDVECQPSPSTTPVSLLRAVRVMKRGLASNPPLPVPSWGNGSADSLETAKNEFKCMHTTKTA